jgi:transforming growth factor-beta-induced protein
MKSTYRLLQSAKLLSSTLWVLLLTLTLALTSCDDDDDDSMESKSIVALAQENSNLSSLEAALVKYPDLVAALGSNTNYTVFAPSNTAFTNLLSAIGQTSIDDVPEDVLREILEYHVVAGPGLKANQLTSGGIETVNGEDVMVSTTGGVKLNGTVNVSTADVVASNGVVHVIDAVLVPPSITPIVGTIVAPAYFNKNFTTLIAAVKAASPSILTTLLNSDAKTLFAPTNEAFTNSGITALPDEASLNAVLAYHVVPAEVMAGDIAEGRSSAETLNGNIYLSNVESGVFINGEAKVTAVDIEGSNGVVHVIDHVLIPPSQTIAQIATTFEFTQLVAALARTQGQGANDLLAAVSDPESSLTVFAPTDAAFQALYDALGVNGVDEIPLATLIAVLKHHVVSGYVFSTDLSTGPAPTLNGNVAIDLSVNPPTVTGSSGTDNKANLQTTLLNIHGTNGVVHVIDKVLLP